MTFCFRAPVVLFILPHFWLFGGQFTRLLENLYLWYEVFLKARQIALLRGCVSHHPQTPSKPLHPAVSPNIQHSKMIIRMNCDLRESFHLVNGVLLLMRWDINYYSAPWKFLRWHDDKKCLRSEIHSHLEIREAFHIKKLAALPRWGYVFRLKLPSLICRITSPCWLEASAEHQSQWRKINKTTTEIPTWIVSPSLYRIVRISLRTYNNSAECWNNGPFIRHKVLFPKKILSYFYGDFQLWASISGKWVKLFEKKFHDSFFFSTNYQFMQKSQKKFLGWSGPLSILARLLLNRAPSSN